MSERPQFYCTDCDKAPGSPTLGGRCLGCHDAAEAQALGERQTILQEHETLVAKDLLDMFENLSPEAKARLHTVVWTVGPGGPGVIKPKETP